MATNDVVNQAIQEANRAGRGQMSTEGTVVGNNARDFFQAVSDKVYNNKNTLQRSTKPIKEFTFGEALGDPVSFGTSVVSNIRTDLAGLTFGESAGVIGAGVRAGVRQLQGGPLLNVEQSNILAGKQLSTLVFNNIYKRAAPTLANFESERQQSFSQDLQYNLDAPTMEIPPRWKEQVPILNKIERYSNNITQAAVDTTYGEIIDKAAMPQEDYLAALESGELEDIEDGSQTLRMLVSAVTGPKGNGLFGYVDRRAVANLMLFPAVMLSANPFPTPSSGSKKLVKSKTVNQIMKEANKFVDEIRTTIFNLQDDMKVFETFEDFYKGTKAPIIDNNNYPLIIRETATVDGEVPDGMLSIGNFLKQDEITKALDDGVDVVIRDGKAQVVNPKSVLPTSDTLPDFFKALNPNIATPKGSPTRLTALRNVLQESAEASSALMKATNLGKRQLRNIWKASNAEELTEDMSKAIAKVDDDILAEARKYKTAEDFVDAVKKGAKTFEQSLRQADLWQRKAYTKAYAKATREAASSLRTKSDYLNDLRQRAVKYVDAAVTDPAAKVRLLNKVPFMTTENQLQKRIIAPAQDIAQKEYRKLLTDDIKASVDTAVKDIKANRITANGFKQVVSFLNDFNLKKPTRKKLRELKKVQKALESGDPMAKAAFTPRQIEELSRLNKTPLAEMSTRDLELVKDTLDTILMRSRANMAAIETAKAVEADAIATALKESNIRNMDNYDGAVYDATSGITGTAAKVMNAIQAYRRGALEFANVDFVFDALGGGKMNELWQAIRVPLKNADSASREQTNAIFTALNDIKAANDLRLENMMRIQAYSASKQLNNMADFTRITGFEKIPELTDAEMAYYNASRQILDEMFPKISTTYAEYSNDVVNYVENFTPLYRQTEMRGAGLPSDQMKYNFRRKNVDFASAESRVENSARLNMDFEAQVKRYIADATRYINMQPELDRVNRVMRDKALREKLGDFGVKYIEDYVDLAARGRRRRTEEGIGKASAFVRQNITRITFGFNIFTAAKQFLAIFNTAGIVGQGNVIKAANDLATKKNLTDFIYRASPSIKNRFGDDIYFADVSRAELERTIGAGKTDQLKKKYRQVRDGERKAGEFPVKIADQVTATVGWLAAYRKKLDDLGMEFNQDEIVQEAVNYADYVINKTQGSGAVLDAPRALTGAKAERNKAIFMFQTFMLNDWNYITREVLPNLSKDPVRGIKQVGYLAAAIIAEDGVDRVSQSIFYPQWQDEEDQLLTAKTVYDGMIGRVPIAGDLYNAFDFYLREGETAKEGLERAAQDPSAFMSEMATSQIIIVDTALSGAAGVLDAFFGEDEEQKTRGIIKSAETAAKMLGAPSLTGMLFRFLKSDYAKATDYEDPLIFFKNLYPVLQTPPESGGVRGTPIQGQPLQGRAVQGRVITPSN